MPCSALVTAIHKTSQDKDSNSSPLLSSSFKDLSTPLWTSPGICPPSQRRKSTGFLTSSSKVTLIKVTILQQADANRRRPNVGILRIPPCLLLALRLTLHPSITLPGLPPNSGPAGYVSRIERKGVSGTYSAAQLTLSSTCQVIPWQQLHCVFFATALGHNMHCFIGQKPFS